MDQVSVNGFSLWVGIGAALGVWRVARSVPQKQAGAWTNISLMVLFASLVGARASYVWVNWGYFSDHPAEIPQVWLGGISWPGALGGAALAVLLLAFLVEKQANLSDSGPASLGWIGDRLYPLLPPMVVAVWLGSWQVGSAYGRLLPPGAWWGVPSLDESGSYNLHAPLQPAAALALLAIFWLLETRVKPLRPPGRLSGLAYLGLLLHLMVTSLLRADPAPLWNSLRVDTWAAIFFFAFFLAVSGINYLFFRSANEPVLPFAERRSDHFEGNAPL